jgi:hypothetical protein
MALSHKVQEVGEIVGEHMDDILNLFKPGFLITVIVRHKDFPDRSRDFIQSNDTLVGALTAIQTRMNDDTTLKGFV